MSAWDPGDVPDDVLSITTVVDLIEWIESWPRAAEHYDLAYHFAAPVGGRLKIEGDPLFNAHSLALDEALIRWAIGHTERLVYPSSSAVYGASLQSEGAGALQEGQFHPAHPNWFAPDEMYGFTKMAGEVLAWKAAAYGLTTLCIRPFSGYGEGQSFDYPIPSIAARALRRENPLVIWGSGNQSRDFIHVDDLVTGTRRRLERPLQGYSSLNLGSGRATTFRQIAEMMAEIVGYDPAIVSDASKPEGVKRRWADTARQALYFEPYVQLRYGLARVLSDVDRRLGVLVP